MEQKARKRPRRLWLLILLLLVALALCLIPFPFHVAQVYSGVLWKTGDAGEAETVEVQVYGDYYRSVLLDNWFSGHITISGLSETQRSETNTMADIQFTDDGGVSTGYLYYRQADWLGSITVEGAFDRFVIHLYDQIDPDAESDGLYYITAPAESRQAAYETAVALGLGSYVS